MKKSTKNTTIPICDYCNNHATLIDSAEVYGKSYGKMWMCWQCNAYVGCHRGTSQPLGRLANAELRKAKIKAHEAFDKLWKTGSMSRKNAYAWLSEQLDMEESKCHIGMFDEAQCLRVIEVCESVNHG